MDHLWSPWRSQYILSASEAAVSRSTEECFLCTAYQKPEHDAETFVVARFAECYAILNRYPYNAGHLLIAPNAHIGELHALPASTYHDMMSAVRIAERALVSAMRCHGMNIGINLGHSAGAGVPGHLHIHLVPRWNGDANFMPVIADVKLVSEAIHDTYSKIVHAFSSLI
jgi:ATP adenylyltransferase